MAIDRAARRWSVTENDKRVREWFTTTPPTNPITGCDNHAQLRCLRRRTGAARTRSPHGLREEPVRHRRTGLLPPPPHHQGRGARRHHHRYEGWRRAGHSSSPGVIPAESARPLNGQADINHRPSTALGVVDCPGGQDLGNPALVDSFPLGRASYPASAVVGTAANRCFYLTPNPPNWVVAVAKRGTMDMEERLSL